MAVDSSNYITNNAAIDSLVMNNLVFLQLWAFCLLPLPLLIYFFCNRKKNNQEIISFPHLRLLQQAFLHSQKKSFLQNLNIRKFALLFLVWILMVIALAQPNLAKKNQESHIIGYDLMLLIDVSGSMDALDFSTKTKLINRLDISKNVINQFIKKRSSDRIGLIVFAKFAYLASPLTIDHISLTSILDNSYIGMAGQETAIGDAITLAVNKLHKKQNNSRAIILLTDGENTAGTIDPIQAAQLAKKYNIPIYTIGIGSNGEVPFLDRHGNLQYGYVRLDVNNLKEIAKITQGKYFNAQNKQELNNIYKEINKLTTSKVKAQISIDYQPLFHYFLIAAILIFIIMLSSSINLNKNREEKI